MSKEYCSQHQDFAISVSKIESIHETTQNIDRKLDMMITQTYELDTRLSKLETQKTERWRVQGWMNKGLVGLMITVIIAFKIYGGK
jgi:hypothetical protein